MLLLDILKLRDSSALQIVASLCARVNSHPRLGQFRGQFTDLKEAIRGRVWMRTPRCERKGKECTQLSKLSPESALFSQRRSADWILVRLTELGDFLDNLVQPVGAPG